MPNKRFNSMHEEPTGSTGAATRESGTAKKGRDGTAAWPGIPGKGAPDRDKSSTPKKGFAGPFRHKSEGI